MKRTALLISALLLAAALLIAKPARAQDYPDPVGYLNDFAGVFDSASAAQFENALRLTEEETTVELAVVTVTDLQGVDINTYAVELFEKWKIGQGGQDNGILFITAIAEREVRIEVGYGLEPYITDARAGRILDDSVIPDFSVDDFALGIIKGAEALRIALDETGYTAGAPPPEPESTSGFLQSLIDNTWPLVVFGGGLIYVIAYLARSKSIWLGGIGGAAAGAIGGWFLGGWVGLLIGLFGLGIGGLILDAILSASYRFNSSSGRSTSWGSTRGGFGGASGGFRTGGGFGGFGGGRSGGGGAGRKF